MPAAHPPDPDAGLLPLMDCLPSMWKQNVAVSIWRIKKKPDLVYLTGLGASVSIIITRGRLAQLVRALR